jgi:hypothetical protein
MAQYLLPTKLHELTEDTWNEVKREYHTVLPSPETADAEMEMWRHSAETITDIDICQLLQHTEVMFPNVHCIFTILLTMPVSTATPERTFSCMRRLKTYLRSSMTESRMNSLALMNIHHEIDINADDIVRDFTSSGSRRMNFS